MTAPPSSVNLSARSRFVLMVLAGIGVAGAAAGAVFAADRMWANWLLVSYYALELGLAGLCLVAIQYATGAHWSVAIRRVPEAFAALIPFAAVALGLVLVVRPALYPWTGGDFGPPTEGSLEFKRMWLSRTFFLARAATYVVVWTLFALAIRGRSRRQDGDGDPRWTRGNVRLSAAFLVIFGVTFTLSAFDWLMSLEPGWYSTIFGVYNFAGLMLSGLAAFIIVAIWLERSGPLRNVLRDEHLHDLAKLMFAFSTFWMYIWFSQYMLIWYTNIPEETSYFVRRGHGGWFALFVLNVIINWVVPFFALIRRDMKRRRDVLVWVSAIVLVGHWLDLYLMILPPFLGEQPSLGPWEIGLVAGGIGFVGLGLAQILRGASPVPLRDPKLVESLHYHT